MTTAIHAGAIPVTSVVCWCTVSQAEHLNDLPAWEGRVIYCSADVKGDDWSVRHSDYTFSDGTPEPNGSAEVAVLAPSEACRPSPRCRSRTPSERPRSRPSGVRRDDRQERQPSETPHRRRVAHRGAACVTGLWLGASVSALGLFVALVGAMISTYDAVNLEAGSERRAFDSGRTVGRAEAEQERAGKGDLPAGRGLIGRASATTAKWYVGGSCRTVVSKAVTVPSGPRTVAPEPGDSMESRVCMRADNDVRRPSAAWLHSVGAEIESQELRSVDLPASGTGDDLRITVRSGPSRDLITLVGEIDLATAPPLHEVVRQLLVQGRHHVSVDFGAVTFVDAAALTFLLAAGRDLAAAGGSLTILGHNPLLTRLVTVAGLTGVLDN